MTYEIDIDPQDIYNNLKRPEKEEFIRLSIDDADDEDLITEVSRRGLIDDIVDRLSDDQLYRLLKDRLGDIINLIHE